MNFYCFYNLPNCFVLLQFFPSRWLPGVARIFEELIGAWRELVPTEAEDSLRQVRRFFSAVRSRMSLQLRSLVLVSITDFRDALLRHKVRHTNIFLRIRLIDFKKYELRIPLAKEF